MKLFFAIFFLSACATLPPSVSQEKRSYAELEAKILALFPKESWEKLGVVGEEKYPLYAIVVPPLSKANAKKLTPVLLTGGAHGDEPAGISVILDFLSKEADRYPGFRFFAFPVINPSGYERNTLENSRQENINRQFFATTKSEEAVLLMKKLREWGVKFSFAMDFHEIPPYWADEGWTAKDNPHAAYLYETQRNLSLRLGRKMVDALPKEMEVCQWPTIYGDKSDRGVVSYPEGNGNAVYAEGTTLDAYVFGKYTEHSFTTETPIGWPLEKRIQTHLTWLRTALKWKARKK